MEVDIYVVPAVDAEQWAVRSDLQNAVIGPIVTTVVDGSIQDNIIEIVPAGKLSGGTGETFGRDYDVVIDVDRSGHLNASDYIDGLGNHAGFTILHDISQNGPHATTSSTIQGGYSEQVVYYPRFIATMGVLPLVVMSHGVNHSLYSYPNLGHYLASYGYVVMAHANDVKGTDIDGQADS